jgi:propionate CoA-transferase
LFIKKEGSIKKFKSEVNQITFSGAYANELKQDVLYVTERAVFKLSEKGLVLIEIAPGIDLQKDILDLMEFRPIIAKDLRVMDEKIFN